MLLLAGSGQPMKVLEELVKYEKMTNRDDDDTSSHDIMAEINHSFRSVRNVITCGVKFVLMINLVLRHVHV